MIPLASLLGTALGLATIIALSRVLPTAEYAAYAIAASIAQFGSVLLFEWLRLSALRFGDHVRFSGMGVIEYYGLIGATLAIAGGLLALAGVAGIGGASALAGILAMTAALGAADGAAALLRARGLMKALAIGLALRSGLALAAGFTTALLTGSALATIVAVSAAYLVSTAPVWPSVAPLCREVRLQRLRTALPELARFGGQLTLAGSAQAAIAPMSRTLVAYVAGLDAAAAFSLAWDLVGKALGALAGAVNINLTYRAMHAADTLPPAAASAVFRENAIALIALIGPAAAGLGLLTEPLAQLAARPELYAGFIAYLPWAIAGCTILVLKSFVLDGFSVVFRSPGLGAAVSMVFMIVFAAAALAQLVVLEPATSISLALGYALVAASVLLASRANLFSLGIVLNRSVLVICVITGAMFVAVWALPLQGPWLEQFWVRSISGVLVYGTLFYLAGPILGLDSPKYLKVLLVSDK